MVNLALIDVIDSSGNISDWSTVRAIITEKQAEKQQRDVSQQEFILQKQVTADFNLFKGTDKELRKMIYLTHTQLNKEECIRRQCLCNSKRKFQEMKGFPEYVDNSMYHCSGIPPHGTVTPACRQWYHPSCTNLQIEAGQSYGNLFITCSQCNTYQYQLQNAKLQLKAYNNIRNEYLIQFDKKKLTQKQQIDIDETKYDPKNNVTGDRVYDTTIVNYFKYPEYPGWF